MQITLLKKLRQACDCICAMQEEPSFFIAERNSVQMALIDPNKGPKCLISKVKHQISGSDQVKATAMVYCELGSKDAKQQQQDENEAYLGVATSEFSFVILKLSTKQGGHSILATIESAHTSDITSVLALTDHYSTLSFVTLSLDSLIKIWSIDGQLEQESVADGQVITGVSVPGKRDYYLVSTCNEETSQFAVGVYRKQKQLFKVKTPDGKDYFEDDILELKMCPGNNFLFIPRGLTVIDRFQVEGI